jgi:two-component system osmolarity sensor histidine kinase EnvZ
MAITLKGPTTATTGGFLKRLLPQTLLGRSLLIIVSPLILLQVLTAWVFFERHWDTVAIRLARGLAGDVAATVSLMRENPTPEGRNAAFQFAFANFNLRMEFREGAIFKIAPGPDSGRLDGVRR